MQRELKAVLLIIASATFFLVALGGFVRATGAGLACPDWPLCFGRVVPPSFADGVFQEWAHRALALIVSLGTVFFAYRVYSQREKLVGPWRLSKVLLAILFVQVILGGLTVIMKLNPFIVTSHLLFGTLFFQLCSIGAIENSKVVTPVSKNRSIPRVILFLSLLIFMQIIIGGFVGSSGAALACPDIPLCLENNFLPEGSGGAQILHMVHRTLGILIVIIAMGVAFLAANGSLARGVKAHAFGLVGLLLLQVTIGFMNVYFRIPVSITVLHLALGEAILLGYLVLYARVAGGSRWYSQLK